MVLAVVKDSDYFVPLRAPLSAATCSATLPGDAVLCLDTVKCCCSGATLWPLLPRYLGSLSYPPATASTCYTCYLCYLA